MINERPRLPGRRNGTDRQVAVCRYQAFGEISVDLIYRKIASLDSFQSFSGISLELLENAAFPFASRRPLKYR